MEVPMKLAGEQGHITVLLSSTYSEIYKPFHCVSCGNHVFSYNEHEVRTILPGGHPQLNRAGKIYQCNGVMKLRSTRRVYDVLWEVTEAAMNIQHPDELREALAYIARDSENEKNVKCKMLYFVS